MPQFDPAYGTLNSILVELIGNSQGGSIAIDNESVNAGLATLTIGTNITVTAPSLLSILSTPLQSITNQPIAADDPGEPFGFPDYIGLDAATLVGTAATELIRRRCSPALPHTQALATWHLIIQVR